MKVKCNKEDIKKGFHIVEGIVSGSAVKPILQNVKIVAKDDKLELSTTDLEVSVSCVVDSVEVIEPGIIVCPEAKMSLIVKEWVEDYIEIIEENRMCLINSLNGSSGSNSYFKVLCTDPEEFPSIPKFVDENYIEIDKSALTDMIKKTSFTIIGEKARYDYSGVFLEIKGDQAKMVANDGRRLAEVKRPVCVRRTGRKVNNLNSSNGSNGSNGLNGLNGSSGSNSLSCIIPLKGILQVLRIISKVADDVARIRIEERRIFVKTRNTVLCSQLIEGQYPNYEKVIPLNLDKRVILDKDTFFSAVRRGSVMTTEEYKLLKFKISNNKLELECVSPDVGEARVDLPIEYSGQASLPDGQVLEIGLNPDYVLDFLKVLDRDKVTLELKDSSTAAVFKVGNNFTYVVMPVSLDGN